jgi:hypothetical protein
MLGRSIQYKPANQNVNVKNAKRFETIKKGIARLKRLRNLTEFQHRELYGLYRSTLHLFEEAEAEANSQQQSLGPSISRWQPLLKEAFQQIGGGAEPCLVSLRSYESDRYGPYLGVSDDGNAAHEFRKAILASPKAEVLGPQPPLVVGAALDAERLAAVGEVVVGRDEYCNIWLACQGSTLMSTNVGTRLNLRYYAVRPVVEIELADVESMITAASERLPRLFAPFWRTLNGKPRSVTVFADFGKGIPYDHRLAVLRALRRRVQSGDFCDPRIHRLGLLAEVGRGAKGVRAAQRHMGIAKAAGLDEVAIQGLVTTEAEDRISLPGLLNYFDVPSVRSLMRTSRAKHVVLTPKNLVDPDTVARQVWAPLQVARGMGLALGKYGLFPLTLEEADVVMGLVQGWFADWSAAPVCYLDLPIVSAEEIYTETEIENGTKRWLQVVAKHQIPVVLFDTAEKAKGRRLMKNHPDDEVGILHQSQIQHLDQYAKRLHIKALWAGGISLAQTLTFGQLKVFGIYVTSAAATLCPVDSSIRNDPSLAAQRRVTQAGVRNTKLVLEAGFLMSRLRELGGMQPAALLEEAALRLIDSVSKSEQQPPDSMAWQSLHQLAAEAWRLHFKSIGVKTRHGYGLQRRASKKN